MTAGGFTWLQKNQSNWRKPQLKTRFHPHPRPFSRWPKRTHALAQLDFVRTRFPTLTAPMWAQMPTRSPCFGPSRCDCCPQTLCHPAQTLSPLPGPPLSTMAPLWSSASSHNVGLSAATVRRATPPFNPSTRKNDWETRGPNKCPFVIPAWKLWRQHKLILVSKVAQTIAWMPAG